MYKLFNDFQVFEKKTYFFESFDDGSLSICLYRSIFCVEKSSVFVVSYSSLSFGKNFFVSQSIMIV